MGVRMGGFLFLVARGSAKQLVDDLHGIVRDGIAAPGDVLIGARKNELVAGGQAARRRRRISTMKNGTPLPRIASANGATATSGS